MFQGSTSQHGDLSPTALSPIDPQAEFTLRIPKNKSTGNLLTQTQDEEIRAAIERQRFSFDAGSSQDVSSKRNSRIDHDGGGFGGASGLRRIRRGPPSRTPTLRANVEDFLAPPLQHASTLPVSGSSSRSASRSASTAQFFISNAISPVIEDLQRFPSESLHSFSFARQSEDFLHSRQAILQKSVELVRDQRTFFANAGIANAQAKVNGDVEMQGMMDLLRRAKVMPQLDIARANNIGLGLGPLTGPASLDTRNIFEKSFESTFEPLDEKSDSSDEELNDTPMSTTNEQVIEETKTAKRPASPGSPQRYGLRRTYTDTKPLHIQQTLLEALAQPYSTEDMPLAQSQDAVSFLPNAKGPPTTSVIGGNVHSHSSKATPAAQAFFRTEADSPWTIQAANDLACLTFGVTRAEVRSLSILGLVQQERRAWLEDKLKQPDVVIETPKSPEVATPKSNGQLSVLGAKGGITARLLSKPPSRTIQKQRAQADDAPGEIKPASPPKHHPARKSRGVVLCGEVLPIQKRDGALGAASFWVMEKRGGFIWVVEEVIEDVAYLEYDKSWRLASSRGDDERIWGEELRSGLKLKYLLPQISLSALQDPQNDGTPCLGHYTAATMGGVNVPAVVSKTKGKDEIRVASLPHIAGVLVLEPENLKIKSSNSVFSEALFGYDQPNGMFIDDLIFNFEAILDILTEQDDQALVDGLVVPEHSFRRARALMALREGKEDAANLFLRPAGLPARHRDGSDIMVDVQMRVVRSESIFPAAATEDVIVEEEGDEAPTQSVAVSQLVYALWITYSRQLHSAGMGVSRPEHPLVSRPATPPAQPPPPESLPSPPQALHLTTTEDSTISRQLTREVSPIEPLEHPPANVPFVPHPRKKIGDFIILEEMGEGAYGEVKLARYQTSRSSKVVIKYVTKKKILVDTWTRDRKLGTVPLEIHVLDFLRRDGYKHPNIVEMIDFFEDDINYYIEMVPHGLPGMDLFDYIELRTTMTESESRNIFRQVVAAIHHLHVKASIVHRDIKDENVVLDGENRVKLIDFGSAAYIKNGPFNVFVGTIDYAAPEVLQGNNYGGCEQDVWALGILLYTIVFKENPFYNVEEILDHPLRLPQLEELDYSDECVDLIQAMLNRDVDSRVKIDEVANHPWMLAES